MIDRIPSDIKSAINKRYPTAASIFAANRNKYQVSIVTNKSTGSTFIGMYIYAAYSSEEFGTNEIARFSLAPSDFPSDSPLNAYFFNFLGYMDHFDLLSKLGKEDLTRAENLMNCGFTAEQGQFSPLLDYL